MNGEVTFGTVSAAVVTIFDAPLMTAKGRKAIVAWLRRQADFLAKHPQELSRRYTARYRYEKETA